MPEDVNITRIKAVANALQKALQTTVFVGGATVSLYYDRPVRLIRPTDDVDVLIEIANHSERLKVEAALIEVGFINDIESDVICRYLIEGITVDIMPTEVEILGFSNRWYPDGFKNAINCQLDDMMSISILTAAFFIGTKLEAFNNRGKNDGRTSSDFEDIISIFENRSVIWQELNDAPEPLRSYIIEEFQLLLSNPYFKEWVSCHVEERSIITTNKIISEIRKLVSNG